MLAFKHYNSKFPKNWTYFIAILVLLVIFSIYSYSIFSDKLFLGKGDQGSRFLIAMQFAHEPSKALDLKYWVSAWPPVPFIIQSFILRLVLFSATSDISLGIKAVELTSVAFVLVGFFFIGRSVAVQTNDLTGLIAFIMSFCTPLMLDLAHTTMSEVYAFSFISLGIYNSLIYIKTNRNFSYIISVIFFVLAYFCRTESIIFSLIIGVFLVAHKRWKSGLLLMSTTVLVAVAQTLGASLLIQGTNFYDRDLWGGKGLDRLKYAYLLCYYFLRANKELILLSFVWIIPLTYLKLKQRKNFKKSEVANTQQNFSNYISQLYNQLSLWLVDNPITIWTILFLCALALPILLALKGALDPIPRYLYLASIFLTTVISLIIAQTNDLLSVGNKRLAKQLVIATLIVVMLVSSKSGLSYASGSRKVQNMPLPVKEVINFISQNKPPKTRVVFDFLGWQEYGIAPYLLAPELETTATQFSLVSTAFPRDIDSEITSLLPKKFNVPAPQSTVEGRTALIHAYIYGKHPSYFVIASDSYYYKDIEKHAIKTAIGYGNNYIRKYLTPKDKAKSAFQFQSPYILPGNKITLTKLYENESFIVLKD